MTFGVIEMAIIACCIIAFWAVGRADARTRIMPVVIRGVMVVVIVVTLAKALGL